MTDEPDKPMPSVPTEPRSVPASRRRHRLDGAVAVVTGASSGIGKQVAIELAMSGCHLVLVARRHQLLKETREACHGACYAQGLPLPYIRIQTCDMGDREQIAELAQSVGNVEGRCDVIINNAGMPGRGAFLGPDDIETFDRVIDVNLRGPVHLIGHLLPQLLESDRAAIVNVTSVAGLHGVANAAVYCASKFGLTGFSEGLWAQLDASNVQVSTVLPGPVPTPSWPHAELRERWFGRRLIVNADKVARKIVKATEPGSNPMQVIPRSFRIGRLAQVLVPPLYRRSLRRVKDEG